LRLSALLRVKKASGGPCKDRLNAALWWDWVPNHAGLDESPLPRLRIQRNMIRAELLKMLVCPENQSALTLASSDLIAQLNHEIASGRLKNKAGQKLERQVGGGLVRTDQSILYPIVDEIPLLLVDEGIPLDQIAPVS
jgi:uncharacterized protein